MNNATRTTTASRGEITACSREGGYYWHVQRNETKYSFERFSYADTKKHGVTMPTAEYFIILPYHSFYIVRRTGQGCPKKAR